MLKYLTCDLLFLAPLKPVEMSIPAPGEVKQGTVIPASVNSSGVGSGPHNANMGGDFDLNYFGQNPK